MYDKTLCKYCNSEADLSALVTDKVKIYIKKERRGEGEDRMSDYDDDFMADDEDYDLEYSEDSNSGK
jgi:hypothetical protein